MAISPTARYRGGRDGCVEDHGRIAGRRCVVVTGGGGGRECGLIAMKVHVYHAPPPARGDSHA